MLEAWLCVVLATSQETGLVSFPDLPDWEFVKDPGRLKDLPRGTQAAYRLGPSWIAIAIDGSDKDVAAETVAAWAEALTEADADTAWEPAGTREAVSGTSPAFLEFHRANDRWRGLAMFRRGASRVRLHAQGDERIQRDLLAVVEGGARSVDGSSRRSRSFLPWWTWTFFFLLASGIAWLKRRLA
jgi:hypothetical protein